MTGGCQVMVTDDWSKLVVPGRGRPGAASSGTLTRADAGPLAPFADTPCTLYSRVSTLGPAGAAGAEGIAVVPGGTGADTGAFGGAFTGVETSCGTSTAGVIVSTKLITSPGAGPAPASDPSTGSASGSTGFRT